MHFNQISFDSFNGRAEALQSIKRFAICKPMFYRTDLFMHSQRVSWIVEALLPFAKKTFSQLDGEKARTLALVHDDAEIITGDVQLYYKLKMTPDELKLHQHNEINAIQELSKRYPGEVNGYYYQSLLLHALNKDCLEAQLVSFADKLDAYGESLHELHAGNKEFMRPVELYTQLVSRFSDKFPQLKSLFGQDHPFLHSPQQLNQEKILLLGTFHKETSLPKNSGVPHYECWKQITVSHERVKWLVSRQE